MPENPLLETIEDALTRGDMQRLVRVKDAMNCCYLAHRPIMDQSLAMLGEVMQLILDNMQDPAEAFVDPRGFYQTAQAAGRMLRIGQRSGVLFTWEPPPGLSEAGKIAYTYCVNIYHLLEPGTLTEFGPDGKKLPDPAPAPEQAGLPKPVQTTVKEKVEKCLIRHALPQEGVRKWTSTPGLPDKRMFVRLKRHGGG